MFWFYSLYTRGIILVFILGVWYNKDMMDKYENQRRWRLKNPNYRNEWWAKNKDKWNAYVKQWRYNIRQEVLKHYSGDKPRCACCGETYIEFLCIDHMNNDGYQQRKKLGGGSSLIYEWLRKNKFPSGYRVLCHNCNQALGFYGYCPHKKNKEEA